MLGLVLPKLNDVFGLVVSRQWLVFSDVSADVV